MNGIQAAYTERSDYAARNCRQADRFFNRLRKLYGDYYAALEQKDGNAEQAAEMRLQRLYSEMQNTRLYKIYGGLYCQILSDAHATAQRSEI